VWPERDVPFRELAIEVVDASLHPRAGELEAELADLEVE
jgi:hypothetical protein